MPRTILIALVAVALVVPVAIWTFDSDESPGPAKTNENAAPVGDETPDTGAERFDLMRREGLTKIRDGILAHREGSEHQTALDNIERQLAKLGGDYYPQS